MKRRRIASCLPRLRFFGKKALKKSSLFVSVLLSALGLAAFAPSANAQTFTSIYSFGGGADGNQPLRLVRDKAGNLYGTTLYGGGGRCNFSAGCGTVFKIDASGHETLLHAFTGGRDGQTPQSNLILDSSGTLYGATLFGGNLTCGYSGGCGTIFKIDASGNKTVLYYFPQETVAVGPDSLTRDTNGNFYGTTQMGSFDGTVFKLDTTLKFSVLHGFSGAPSDGNFPNGALVRDNSGNLFGTSYQGGTNDSGTIYKVDSTGTETVLYSFNNSSQGNPSGLTLVGQYLYGVTAGTSAAGTVFRLDKSGNVTTLYTFTGGIDGGGPSGSLATDGAGNLYGTTFRGGAFGAGTVFKLDTTSDQLTVLYSFTGGVDGYGPGAGVIRAGSGVLYGTTLVGGTSGMGTVFKITP